MAIVSPITSYDTLTTKSLVEEQLKLFFNHQTLPLTASNPIDSPNKKLQLGQVFTPPILAKFMVKLFKTQISPTSTILDPCIGPNTFLKHLDSLNFSPSMTGIEIDKDLIDTTILDFYDFPNRNLIQDSFFNFSTENKFDFIIQNPPYVRQELLKNENNVKQEASQSVSGFSKSIPSQSNLYVYFLLKSILHLKENGILIAVIYDSWLYSNFGKFLKKMLLDLGQLEHIYHFKKNAFPNIEVGATVIYFKKTKGNSKPIQYSLFWTVEELKTYETTNPISKPVLQKDFIDYKFNGNVSLEFNNDFFLTLKEVSKHPIQRGTSSIANQYFIQQTDNLKETVPFVKDISKIQTFSVEAETAYLLAVNGHLSDETKKYLEKTKTEILNTPRKFIALKRTINTGKIWYKVKIKKSGNFIFNYYMRRNVDFIYNEKHLITSDNFYTLQIKNQPLAHLAILNSSFSRLAVLAHSRNQGNGLKKIQAYEFKEVPIINIRQLPEKEIEKLNSLGTQLKNINRYNDDKAKVIQTIDELLLKEYNSFLDSNLTLKEINEDLKYYFQ